MAQRNKNRVVVLDVETTGFGYKSGDRIIEIGVVEVIGNEIIEEPVVHKYVNPGKNISRRITDITGISNKHVKNKPKFEHHSICDELLDFIGRSKIVAHNAPFDRGFINFELAEAGKREIPKERWIDTIQLAKRNLWGLYA